MTTNQHRTALEAAALTAYRTLVAGPATRELAVASRDAIRELAEAIGIDEDTAHAVVVSMYNRAK